MDGARAWVIVGFAVGAFAIGVGSTALASVPGVTPAVVAPSAEEGGPGETTVPTTTVPGTTVPGTTPPPEDGGSTDDPSAGELWAATLAILGAIALGIAVVLMVNRAHAIQRQLAAGARRQGQTVITEGDDAAGRHGLETTIDGAPPATPTPPVLVVTSPAELHLGAPAEYTVPTSVAEPTWTVNGLDVFGQSRVDPHRFVLTPHEIKPAVTVTVAAGDATPVTTPPLPVLPAEAAPFVVRLFVRNWGLIVVANVVVFGAVALGLAGRLDGANFVALVAPLAALLGVTTAGGSRSDEGQTGAGGG